LANQFFVLTLDLSLIYKTFVSAINSFRRRRNSRAQTLRSLDNRHSETIKAVKADSTLKRRILDMGLIPGVRIDVLDRAPLKDPITIRISGFILALRNTKAEQILVEKEEANYIP
jgi:ferrous iron transport protein A